jgi:hypothetical protein
MKDEGRRMKDEVLAASDFFLHPSSFRLFFNLTLDKRSIACSNSK